jgi:hypothetical protein
MVVTNGYPLETYRVNTEDGWALSLYRIPHGRFRNTQRGNKPLAYLHHGITLSSACFTALNPNESLAFILADAGVHVCVCLVEQGGRTQRWCWRGCACMRGGAWGGGGLTLARCLG